MTVPSSASALAGAEGIWGGGGVVKGSYTLNPKVWGLGFGVLGFSVCGSGFRV